MLAALSLLCAAFSGCQEEGPVESRALLTTESEILLPAAENSRVITIYADGTWQAEVSDSWLTISPASGEGTTEITMHASYNSAETPRDAKIFFKVYIIRFVLHHIRRTMQNVFTGPIYNGL